MPVEKWDRDLDALMLLIEDPTTKGIVKVMREHLTNGAFEHLIKRLIAEEKARAP